MDTATSTHDAQPNFTERKSTQIKATSFGELTPDNFPLPPMLVEGMFQNSGFYLLAAPPKSGKTTLVLQLIESLALGVPFLGRDVKPSSVLFFSLEDEKGDLAATLNHMNVNVAALGQAGCNVVDEFQNTSEDAILKELQQYIDAYQPKFIVIDTLADVLEPTRDYHNENRQYKKYLDFVRRNNIVLLGLTHTTKSKTANPFNSIRGNGGNAAKVKGMLVLDREPGTFTTKLAYQGKGIGVGQYRIDYQTNPDTMRAENPQEMDGIGDWSEGSASSNVGRTIRDKILDALTVKPTSLDELTAKVGSRKSSLKNTLMEMVQLARHFS